MLTTEDIQNLISFLREVFVTKEDFLELKTEIRALRSDVANIATEMRHNNE